MSQRVIATILDMKDKASKPLIKVSAKTKELNKQTRQANNAMIRFGKNALKSMDKLVVSSAKAAAGLGSLVGAFAIKTGFGEAMDMEGFRTQLETATKSAKKAGEIMKWSVNLANSTPFETGNVIEMSSKFEAMGMSAKKWGGITADMAGATNKDIIQATEAIIDAQAGELERLKEFGIKKTDIAKKAGEMFKNQEVINAKGQIVDQAKFNEALMALMEDKYKGGANALANTAKGMWSTVMGVTKTSLANIVGMQNDGTIKQGSMLDLLKHKIKKITDTLAKWQEDGTIQKIADKVTRIVKIIIKLITKVFKFIKKHKTLLTNILIVIGSFLVAVKIGMAIIKVIKGIQIAMLLLNGTIVVSPFGWLIIIIGAVIAVGALLWKNWDKIKTKAEKLWGNIKSTFSGIKDSITGAFTSAKEKVKGFFSWIGNKLSGLNKKIEEIPILGTLFKGFKKGMQYTPVGLGISAIKGMQSFAKGGIATQPSIFGEAGAEMAIPLKRNNPRSKQLLSQANSIVNGSSNGISIIMYIDTFVGEEGFVDTLSERMVSKLKRAIPNIA